MRRRPLVPVVVCAGLALLCATPVLTRTWANTRGEYSTSNLTTLRDEGAAGLRRFIAAHNAELAQLKAEPNSSDPQLKELKTALNTVGGAYDNWSAGLYWYTDLEKAKAQAAKEGKPILSLRMLGNLTDEYSCANSRFFRAALYPNAKINEKLRDRFILHWSSERAVPVVTIDYGDGRKIKRTLTGNSAHYLLDAKGQPLDVLPGLYAPGAFNRWLEGGETLYKEVVAKPEAERAKTLAVWHKAGAEKIWKDFVKVTSMRSSLFLGGARNAEEAVRINPLMRAPVVKTKGVPTAEEAEMITYTKVAAEMPMLTATTLYTSPGGAATFQSQTDDYQNYARTFLHDAKLDQNSLALVKAHLGEQPQAQIQTVNASTPPETPVTRFEKSMSSDTARNEIEMHVPIHALFVSGKQGNFEELNRRIYDRLFLTPASDPWLGLEQRDVYTGLSNAGITEPESASRVRIREVKQG